MVQRLAIKYTIGLSTLLQLNVQLIPSMSMGIAV